MAEKRKLLSDHKRVGKRLVPPLVHMLPGPMNEVSWVKTIIPEMCWLGLVQMRHGHRDGVELITAVARSARTVHPNRESLVFGAISNYAQLSLVEWQQMRDRLLEDGELFPVQEALRPLVVLYPECPLRNLFQSSPGEPIPDYLETMKQLLELMFLRRERDPMMFQATFVCLAFDAGTLSVAKGLALAEFPKIQDYPDTELSLRIGASIRSTLNMMFGKRYPQPWSAYFWNRGLQLDECEFNATTA
jgi:hypothetical protein